MTERENLLTSIAGMISDYRDGKIDLHPVEEHVSRWIGQFNPEVQVPMLRELNHVFQRTYISNAAMRQFLTDVAGRVSCEFWQSAYIYNNQKRGISQSKIMGVFDEILKDKCGSAIKYRKSANGNLIYFDDAVFTGDHVINDLDKEINKISNKTQLYIIVIASHTYAEYRIKRRFSRIKVNMIRKWRYENRRSWHKSMGGLVPTDVLRPSEIGKRNRLARASSLFSSVEGRELLEKQFLNAGEKIREFAKNPNPNLKPLGYSNLESGFGSLFVTYRNCPNNCPLALWYGDPSYHPSHPFSLWYPLFPRRTYLQ